MTSAQIKEITEEWHELGFHYSYDESSARWIISGSRAGVLKFRDLLVEYSQDKQREMISEHEHYGPYAYLKVTTRDKAFINSDAIHGTLNDIARLGKIVEQRLAQCKVGDTLIIDKEYSLINEAVIELKIQTDEFDPVALDTNLLT